MNDFLIMLLALGFAVVTWLLLVVSDWLLGENVHDRK
jgi:hypothetical protein